MTEKKRSSRGLMLIAAFKLLKGVALLALGIGALKLLHKDLAMEAERWIDLLRVDPQNPLILRLLEKLGMVDPHKLKQLGIGTFFYAALFLTEGTGLALRRRWAEYLTIISTASFLPIEAYEIAKHVSAIKIALLLVNIAVVIYLILELRRTRPASNAA